MCLEGISAVLIPGMDEPVTVVYLEIDDYNGSMTVNGFCYQSQDVKLVVYRIAEESRETLWTTE